jgi:hypothetical protein
LEKILSILINNKWGKIRKLYDAELNKKDKKLEPIDTEKYIIPKQEVNIMKLKEEVEKLNTNEIEQVIHLFSKDMKNITKIKTF